VKQAAKVQEECAPEVVEAVEKGTVAVSAATVLTELPEERQKEVLTELLQEIGGGKITAPRIKKAVKVLLGQTANVHVSDDSYEWYTPAEYINAAKTLMGDIDLDPASSDAAQEVVEARRFYYSKSDDGLSQEWRGRVWLNPPYSAQLVRAFVDKLRAEYEADNISHALLLVNNATDTQWFQELLSRYPVCFTRGRVKFWGPDKEGLGARQGQAVIYLGDNSNEFTATFSAFGTVVEPA
jgi:ParB family chromosome partitioning protein